MNDGTDAKNEMETWASPDTNRTDITTLLKNKYNMIEIKKWSEMTIVEQEQWRKEQTAQLEAEKLKLAEAMELDSENESGIIKIEIRKGDKVVTTSMYLENYLKVKKLHQISLGDDMIDSLINELKD
jgi:hypothetical protein